MAEISSTYPGSGSRNISNFINILPILGRNICDSVSHINLHARPRIGDIPTFYRYSRFYSQNIREIGEPFTSGGLVASHALLIEGGEWKWRPTQGQAVSDPGQVTVKFADSNLETFPPSEAQGKISGASRPPRDADETFSKPVPGSDESPPSGWLRSFTVAAYKPYFDVDTSDVLERIKDSLFPFNGSFSEKVASNPDLYGPFWICTTLIFVAASIGTFVTYVAHKIQKKEWDYDINLVTWSAGLFYGYVTIIPLGLYIILKYFSAPSGLAQLLCLYGYSLFIFIPALLGSCRQPFVALNLRAHIKSAGERWFLIVAAIFLLQLALAAVLKIYLFTVTV
uniref:Protein YIP n=1 Tax=Vitis vinifera TaxID=29760 RepID=A5BLA3_VITVI|nr:hypothetical protein VITISV_015340 [Vitis vinifera]